MGITVGPAVSSASCATADERTTSLELGKVDSTGPAPKEWSPWPWVMKIRDGVLPDCFTHAASLSPSAVVIRESTRIASVSPAISVDVDAGHVACWLGSHPGPPGIGL